MAAPAMFSRCNCDGITPSRKASMSVADNSCLSPVPTGASLVSGGAGVLADLGGVVSFTVCAGDVWANTNPADTQIHRLTARIKFFIHSSWSCITSHTQSGNQLVANEQNCTTAVKLRLSTKLERETQSDLAFTAGQTLGNSAEQRPGALLDLYGCGIAIVE